MHYRYIITINFNYDLLKKKTLIYVTTLRWTSIYFEEEKG
jgi:hypothetical protein